MTAQHSQSDSLLYCHKIKSAAYTWGASNGSPGKVLGVLLDNDNDEFGYMDEKVMIFRL